MTEKFRVLALRIVSLLRRNQLESDLESELRSHLELLRDDYLKRGLSPEEARYAALRAFGGLEQVKEEYREQRGVFTMETLWQDVKYGLRQLQRNPGFTLVAVLTLALGIGANTAIFSVVNAVVLRPLPYPESDRLIWVAEFIPALKAELASGADYLDWRDQNNTAERMAAYDESGSFNMTGRGTPARAHAADVSANFFATIGVDPQLGRAFTAEEDRPRGPNAVVLMHAFWQQYFGSDPHVLGQSVTLDAQPYTIVGVMPSSFRFPGDSSVQMLLPLALDEANERLRVQNRLVRIIGRLRPGVTLARATNDFDAILKRMQPPASGPAGGSPMAGPGPGTGGRSMIRIATGGGPPPAAGAAAPGLVSPQSAPAGPPGARVFGEGSSVPAPAPAGGEVQFGATPDRPAGAPPPGRATHVPAGSPQREPGTAPQAPAIAPGGGHPRLMPPPEVQLRVTPLAEHIAGSLRTPMLILLGVVGLVLLIACANVANLTLTRASARAREVAVRAVLGAGRWRLVRQLLSESVILALAGGAAGLLLAAWGVGVMTRLIPASMGGEVLSLVSVRVDMRVLLFALALSVFTGLLFGLAPALVATRLDFAERLKEGAATTSAGPRRRLLRDALAVAELALALVLLIGAGLLIKSFYRVLSVDPGYTADRVLTMNLSLTDGRYPKPDAKRLFFSEVLRRVESLPGVRSAAVGDALPLSQYHMMLRIHTMIDSGPLTSRDSTIMMSRLTVSPAYFYTLGIPVLKGRTFTDHDDERSEQVAVINQSLAERLWPGKDPVGRQIPVMGSGPVVVGVVGDTRHNGLSEDVDSEFYVPYLQDPGNNMQLAVRTATDPTSLASAVRSQILAIDSEQPIYNVTTLEQTLSDSVSPRRFNMVLLGIFAGIALALATVGIYGVMAFSVTQRTHEIGIRMALGAERRNVLRLVVSQGLALTLAGVAIGVGGALALTRFLTTFLYGVRPTDLATFALVSAVLLLISILASYIPARRATKVDPIVALRYE